MHHYRAIPIISRRPRRVRQEKVRESHVERVARRDKCRRMLPTEIADLTRGWVLDVAGRSVGAAVRIEVLAGGVAASVFRDGFLVDMVFFSRLVTGFPLCYAGEMVRASGKMRHTPGLVCGEIPQGDVHYDAHSAGRGLSADPSTDGGVIHVKQTGFQWCVDIVVVDNGGYVRLFVGAETSLQPDAEKEKA